MSAAVSPARRLAHAALCAAYSGSGRVTDTLDHDRHVAECASRDAALARQIALGAARHRGTIEHVLTRVARYDPRRVSASLRALLHCGAFQLIWLSRVPLHSAVDETVALGKAAEGVHPASMLNAILRRLAAAIVNRRTPWHRGDVRQVRVNWGEACALSIPVEPSLIEGGDPSDYLAAATGETPQHVRTLLARHGAADGERVLWAQQAQPALVLQRNPLRCTPDAFRASIAHDFGDEAACDGEAAWLLDGAVGSAVGFRAGQYHVQDCTAHRAARLLVAQPGERVLDLCAAPGGKTVVLAQDMRNEGTIVAVDVSDERLARLSDNLARTGVTCVALCRAVEPEAIGSAAAPFRCPADDLVRPFDAALVDVPCSNTGVIARRPEARWRRSPAMLRSLAALQSRLLAAAGGAVRPGGRLVYSTCSIEPAENEARVAEFVEQNAGWSVARQETTLPHWGPSVADWRDGGYMALLERR